MKVFAVLMLACLLLATAFTSEHAVSEETTLRNRQAQLMKERNDYIVKMEAEINNTVNCNQNIFSPVCDHSLITAGLVAYHIGEQEKREIKFAERAATRERFAELRRTKPEIDWDSFDEDRGKGVCRVTSVSFPTEIEGYVGEVILLRDHSSWEVIGREFTPGISAIDLCVNKGVTTLHLNDRKLQVKNLSWRLIDKAEFKGDTGSFIAANQVLRVTSQHVYQLLNKQRIPVDLDSKQCLVFEYSAGKYRILLDGNSDQFLAKKIR
jgi:hypothetical protein